MVLVRPSLGSHIHLNGSASKLHGVDAGLDFELFESVDRGPQSVYVVARVGVLDPVKGVVIELAARPGYRERALRPLAALPRRRLTSGALFSRHVRAESNHLQIIAPIERKLDDAFVFDHRPDGRVLGSEQGRATLHLDRFANHANFHAEVDARNRAYLQKDVAPGSRLEPLLLDANGVSARNQKGNVVCTRLICLYLADLASRRVLNRDCRAYYNRSGRISHSSSDFPDVWLRRGSAERKPNAA